MMRLILLLALAYGVFWCYNNLDFVSIKNSTIENIKKEKTIKAVGQSRDAISTDVERVLEN